MSYIQTRPRVRSRRRKRGLGDLIDTANEIIGQKLEIGCLNLADTDPVIAGLDAKMTDLAKNWNPTGYYTPADLQAVMSSVNDAIASARAALATALFTTSDAAQQVAQATDYLDRVTARGALYPAAMAKAQATGVNILNAPGLKQWVLDSLVNVAQAYTTVAVLACQATWLDKAAAVFNAVWGIVKRVVGIVMKAGDTALKIADDVLDLYAVVKWGAIGIGALFVFKELRKRW